MRERDIEKYLRDQVKVIGGRAYKWVSPGNQGVPDRLVFLPGGRVIPIELKAPGETPTAQQLHQHRILQGLGQEVLVIDSMAGVENFIAEARKNLEQSANIRGRGGDAR